MTPASRPAVPTRTANGARAIVGNATATTRAGLLRWLGRVALAASLPLLLAACSKPAPVAPSPVVLETTQPALPERITTASVLIVERLERTAPIVEYAEISPVSVVADPGETVQLAARAFAADGQQLADLDFVWGLVDPSAGTVTDEGLFQAGTRPGVFNDTITVSAIQNTPDGIKFAGAFASVTVVGKAESPWLSRVEIFPDSPTLFEHQIYQMRAIGFDAEGVVIPGVSFVWKLNNAAMGRLNDIGYLTVEAEEGFYEDAVTVTGIWDGASVSMDTDIRVIAAPRPDDFLTVHALPQKFFIAPKDRIALTAVALNGLGELIVGTELRWEMADSHAGTIDGSGNFIAGPSTGVYTDAVRVEALVPGEEGFVRAEDFVSVVIRELISSKRLRALVVEPSRVVLPPGGWAAIVARAVDESGDPVGDVKISWEVVHKKAGEVGAEGVFRGGNNAGIYPQAIRVTAEHGVGEEAVALERTVDVTVTGTLSRSEVQPVLATVRTGKTVHFSLTGWDENGVKLPGLVVRWSLSDDSIGTIDAFGNFVAGDSPGIYRDAIRAAVTQTLP